MRPWPGSRWRSRAEANCLLARSLHRHFVLLHSLAPACTAGMDKKDFRGEGSGLAAPMIKRYFHNLAVIDRAEAPSAREGDSRRGGLPGCCHTPQGFEGSISHV